MNVLMEYKDNGYADENKSFRERYYLLLTHHTIFLRVHDQLKKNVRIYREKCDQMLKEGVNETIQKEMDESIAKYKRVKALNDMLVMKLGVQTSTDQQTGTNINREYTELLGEKIKLRKEAGQLRTETEKLKTLLQKHNIKIE